MVPQSFLPVITLILSTAISTAGYGILNPYIVLNLQNAGVSAGMTGIVISIWYLPIILFSPFYPRVITALGTVKASVLGLSIAAVSLLGFGLTTNPFIWMTLQVLGGFGFGLYWLLTEALITRLSVGRWRGKLLSIYGVAPSTGAMLGSLIPSVVGYTGLIPMVVAAGLMLSSLGPLLAVRNDLARTEEDVTNEPETAPRSFGYLLPVSLVLLALCSGIFETVPWGMLPVYALANGNTDQVATLMLTVFFAGQIVLSIPYGHLIDVYGSKAVLRSTAIGTVLVSFMLHYTIGSALWVWPVVMIWGVLINAFYTLGLTILGEETHPGALTRANSIFLMIFNLASLSGPPLVGTTIDLFGPSSLLIVMSVAAITCGATTFFKRIPAEATG